MCYVSIHIDLIKFPFKTVSRLDHQYFTTLHNLFDKYGTLKKKDIPKHPHIGFVNVDILADKCFKRRFKTAC